MEDTKTPIPETDATEADAHVTDKDAPATDVEAAKTSDAEAVEASLSEATSGVHGDAKPKFKLFDYDKPLPKYLREHGKLHEILMMMLTFVVVPIVSILIVTLTAGSVGLRVVQTTVSMLAWFNGKLAEVYVWGFINLALYAYLLVLNLDGERYSKPVKIAFYVVFGLSVVILMTGLSIRFTEEHTLEHSVHNSFAIIGFVLSVVVFIAVVITQYWRNRTHAVIMTAFLCFFVITGIFSIPQINAPDADAFITAASQMYVFSMMHILLALNYCLSKLTPATKKA